MSKLNQEKLAEMSVSQLKELLQRQGLSTSGTKQVMIDRLLMANPAGPGVMVVETVSVSKPAVSKPDRTTSPQLSEAVVEAVSGLATVKEPAPPDDDPATLIAQLKELVAQAQAAAETAQKAAQDAAAKGEKKEKKGKKKKGKK